MNRSRFYTAGLVILLLAIAGNTWIGVSNHGELSSTQHEEHMLQAVENSKIEALGVKNHVAATNAAHSAGTQLRFLQGKQGLPGVPGHGGTIGAPGVPGGIGPIGPQGVKGAPGPAGPPGAPGAPGVNGLDGLPGQPGVKGDTGPTGPSGETGTQGPKGDRKSTRLNSSHYQRSRMPSSA